MVSRKLARLAGKVVGLGLNYSYQTSTRRSFKYAATQPNEGVETGRKLLKTAIVPCAQGVSGGLSSCRNTKARRLPGFLRGVLLVALQQE
eukprot:642410-Amphidinium_carterae.1